MVICTDCDKELKPEDWRLGIEGTQRTLTFCWECAKANTSDPVLLISCPELVEIFDTPLH